MEESVILMEDDKMETDYDSNQEPKIVVVKEIMEVTSSNS